MAIMNRGTHESPSPDGWSSGQEQHYMNEKHVDSDNDRNIVVPGHEVSSDSALHRGLKARHITMIAIGGAIGTGLIIGTGAALARAGPGSVFIAYTFIGFIVFLVMAALGEMAAWMPMSSGFTGYATRYCDPSLGFALGWTYWFKYIIVTPNQLTAAALVIQYWVDRKRVNPGVFITVFLVVIVAINYFGIRFFGEFEFWLSSFKVITIVGLILLSLIIALGGGPDGDRRGFRYWKNPGAFKTYIAGGDVGKFYAFWSTMVTAVFAYLGTELVGVTVGEAQNPRKVVPRAIKLTFYRIIFFYCLSVLFIGMCLPYNSPRLIFATKQQTGASASPFVVAIIDAGIPVLPDIINGAILIFVFSASNSDLYIASRTLYGLACNGNAPKIFKRTDARGVPIYALGMSAAFALLAYMNVADDSKVVFGYFVNLVSMFGLESWISILVTHVFWCKAKKAQGIPNTAFPYVAPFGMYGSYFALFWCVLIGITKNFNVFTHSPSTYGKFDYKNFVTGYIGIPIYLIALFGHKVFTKSRRVRALEADFYTGKDIIDREEEEFLAAKAAKLAAANGKKGKGAWFYKTFVSWLF